MPLDFRILPRRGLVYVRYRGHVSFSETEAAFAAYLRHPDMRHGQKQLIDLARVTDWDRDFAALLRIQAQKADGFVGAGHEMLLVYYAPSAQARKMARMVLQSWEEVPGVIPVVQETEAGALEVLGLSETSFDAVLETA